MNKILFLLLWITSTYAYAQDKGEWVWNCYYKGSTIASIPADSIDSVALVAQKQIKFLDKKRQVLAAKLISQIDSIALSYYINNDSTAVVDARWNWKDLGRGAMYGQTKVEVFGYSQYITLVKYPAANFTTSIIDAQWPDHATTPAIAQRNNAIAAINGGFFNTTNFYPTTFFSINGEVLGETTQSESYKTRITGYVGFYDKEGHQIEIASYNNSQTSTYAKKYYTVLAAGPLLMTKKQILPLTNVSFNTDRHPRTVIGYDDKGYIYYMVIDGRNVANGANGVTIAELAKISRFVGMTYALNLDGGGSSCIWSSSYGTLNYPSDNGKWDHNGARTIVNIVMMK